MDWYERWTKKAGAFLGMLFVAAAALTITALALILLVWNAYFIAALYVGLA